MEPSAVGAPTEDPRPDPTEAIRERYQEGGGDRPAEGRARDEEEIQGETTGTATGKARREKQ